VETEKDALSKPPHLVVPKRDARDWLAAHAFGLAALLTGVIAFIVVVIQQKQLWSSPDWRLTVPFFVVSIGLATTSLVRREGVLVLPLLGIGLAAAATVMGWFLITAIVVAVAAIIILIMSHVM
jgi:hypothetical protein